MNELFDKTLRLLTDYRVCFFVGLSKETNEFFVCFSYPFHEDWDGFLIDTEEKFKILKEIVEVCGEALRFDWGLTDLLVQSVSSKTPISPFWKKYFPSGAINYLDTTVGFYPDQSLGSFEPTSSSQVSDSTIIENAKRSVFFRILKALGLA